eukprot:TRINITY_DN25998_c0_g1_i1.p1 TRINITY_DN25998_c0_g1~~TRINITY_DN25998_c0_g1_i1.p1  ORF type:complete len:284 (-),score=44.27 TRINITY_DN25998_c0_g1_i1:14-865(-)
MFLVKVCRRTHPYTLYSHAFYSTNTQEKLIFKSEVEKDLYWTLHKFVRKEKYPHLLKKWNKILETQKTHDTEKLKKQPPLPRYRKMELQFPSKPRHPVIWSILIDACVKTQNYEMGEALWSSLCEESVKPNISLYGSRIELLLKSGQIDKAFQTLEEMNSKLQPNGDIYHVFIDHFASRKDIDQINNILKIMESKNVPLSTNSFCMLIEMFLGVKDMDRVMAFLSKSRENKALMPSKIYNAILTELLALGQKKQSLELYEFLLENNLATPGSYRLLNKIQRLS